MAASEVQPGKQGWRAWIQTPRANKIFLTVCALTWGFSFFVMKDATEVLPVYWLLALRFSIAAVLSLIFFWKPVRAHLNRHTVGVGLLFGVLEWGGYAFQTMGLTMTTPGKNAFLTGVYVVIVPFLAWLFRMGKPKRYDVVAALLCVAGMFFVASDAADATGSVNAGDMLTLVGSVFYALQILAVVKWGEKLNIWALSTWQFIAMAGCSALIMPFETAPGAAAFTPTVIAQLLFFGVICSFVALTVMNYAFTRVDPSEGSLLSSLESPSGVFFSVLAGYEALNGRLVTGFILIFIAILISNGWPWFLAKLRGAKAPHSS